MPEGTDGHIGIDETVADKKVDTEKRTTDEGEVHLQRARTLHQDGVNNYGTVLAVANGATGTIVTFVAPAGWRFAGFEAGGEGDGLFFVQFGVTTKYSRRTNIVNRHASVALPEPDATAGGQTVTLKVTNNSVDTADFEGTLLGVQD